MTPDAFLRTLWGDQPPGLIQLWKLAGRRSTYIRSPEAAVALVPAGTVDTYVGVGTAARDLGRHARAKVDEIAAIAGLWLDLDVNGGPENKQGAAPDQQHALNLARAELEPTLLINSGYGVHGWWLFDEPWKFASVAERTRAATASLQWYELHRRHATWTIDGTHDLSRLLRIPGTVNGKGGQQAPVTVIEQTDCRYSVDELLERCASAGAVARPGGDATVKTGVRLAEEQFATLATNARFAATWRHERTDHPGWSLSEYDLALCSQAALAGWNDQQLADLIATHRAKYGDEDGKANRPDYVQRTIALARQAAEKHAPAPADPQPRTGTSYTPGEWGEHILDMLTREDEGVIPIPFVPLCEALDGGLRPGEVCLVAGYTSHGKSIYVDMIADLAAASGRRVHLYMTEMTAFQRGLRLLARRTGVPFRHLKRRDLSRAEWALIAPELTKLGYGCSIVSDWSVDQVVAHIRENRWDVAVVDLIHGFHYHDERDLSKTSSALVRAAKGSVTDGHLGTAVVAAAHLNDGQMRDARSPVRPRPGLHSIKGSSALKQDADVVVFVWQQDDDDGLPTGNGQVWIAKSRQGELGAVDVTLNPTRMQFETDEWRGREEMEAA